MNHSAILQPLKVEDFEAVTDLATTIWRSHYSKIISLAQIDYMLADRCDPQKLRAYINSNERWFSLLWIDHNPVGYCSMSLINGSEKMKLEQLYLIEKLRGLGWGSFMLKHIECESRINNARLLNLQVNKQNLNAVAVYLKAGFQISEESKFDIGNGYWMDDYVMEKKL